MLTGLLRRVFGENKPTKAASLCPVCGRKDVSFLPLPALYRENAEQHGFLHFGKGEMTAHDTYSCGSCGASDRERMYAIWIERQIEEKAFLPGQRLIHFAPEPALSRKLKGLDFFKYSTADLLMDDVDHKVDMMNMPFETGSFDFFICSHVLEHVESDDQAIRELYRVTRQGGCGILMAPIIVGLEQTLEDASVKDEANRWRLFGQSDHVRLYARGDYVSKVRRGGFTVEQLGIQHFGEDVFRLLGLKPSSVLYIVSR